MFYRALGLLGALGLATAQKVMKVPSISLCAVETAQSNLVTATTGSVAVSSLRTLSVYPSANAGLYNSPVIEGVCAANQAPITDVTIGTIATACQPNPLQPITLRFPCVNGAGSPACPTSAAEVQAFCSTNTRIPSSYQSTCAAVLEFPGGAGNYKIKGSTFYFGYQSTPIFAAGAGAYNVEGGSPNVQCTYWPVQFTNTQGWPGQGNNRFTKCPVGSVRVETTLATPLPAAPGNFLYNAGAPVAGDPSPGLGVPVNYATSIVLTYQKPCAPVSMM